MRRKAVKNRNVVYVIAVLVVIVAFLFLGADERVTHSMHRGGVIYNLNWLQILLSLILGFLLGLVVSKRKKMVTIGPVKRCEHQNGKNLQLENNTID